MKTRAHFIAGFVLLALFWGGSFLAIRVSIEAFPPFAAVALRVGIATAIMGALMMFGRGRRPQAATVTWHLLGIGCFTLGIPWALLFWGEQFVSPAMGAIINSTTPIYTVLITVVFTNHEQVRWNKWLGIMLGFCGVVIIFAPAVAAGAANDLRGMAAITGMAVCYAVGIVWLKTVAHRVNPAPAFFYQGLGALVLIVPLVLIFELPALRVARWASLEAWIAIVYLGVCSTAIAQLIFFVLLRERGSVKAAAVTYLVPVIAIVLDWIALGRLPGASALIGTAVILAGVRLIHTKQRASTPVFAEEAVVVD